MFQVLLAGRMVSGREGGSGTLVALRNDFPGLTGCFFLQTNPMSLCTSAVHIDQLQRRPPQGVRARESLLVVLQKPLMFVFPSLGCILGAQLTDDRLIFKAVSFKDGFFQK